MTCFTSLNQPPSNNSAFQGLKRFRFLVCSNCKGVLPCPDMLSLRLIHGKQKSWSCPSCKYINHSTPVDAESLEDFKVWICPCCGSKREFPKYVDVTPFVKWRDKKTGFWKPIFPKRRSFGWRWLPCPACRSRDRPVTGFSSKRVYISHKKRRQRSDKIWTPLLYIEVAKEVFLRKVPISVICEKIYRSFRHRISVKGFIVYHLGRVRHMFKTFVRLGIIRDHQSSSSYWFNLSGRGESLGVVRHLVGLSLFPSTALAPNG